MTVGGPTALLPIFKILPFAGLLREQPILSEDHLALLHRVHAVHRDGETSCFGPLDPALLSEIPDVKLYNFRGPTKLFLDVPDPHTGVRCIFSARDIKDGKDPLANSLIVRKAVRR